ncbi:MAG TPA: hypothetical protein VFU71_21905 [Burkholderiaceae bacterium]|nr:hypothetical protein [Burkholderiaceae bacterium]
MRSPAERSGPAAHGGNDCRRDSATVVATPERGGAARGARCRNPDELIRWWHLQRSAAGTTNDSNPRGYDVRYEQAGITHERATAEAAAALAMMRQYG